MGLTPRIKRRIAQDYTGEDRQAVEEILHELVNDLTGGAEERIVAATLIRSQAKVERFLLAVQIARDDSRGILMSSGLEHEDWRERLDAEFGTDS
ncbi:hypothetical protein AQJ84_34320 [Streptomyces resistomycificus]|uniref:Uncharacterized protein n=2 Tax=Streptomyces resistomycificus TaxID=67356 RepID=A0A0L8L4J3_9ACTN|nr:hypothetical protein ADK37_24815 [Streptomyces resistomycificus]KUN92180.1 hypothetical protein AQJ84_34320 [Streptomyces resistomycificus]